MQSGKSSVERAFELARSGRYRTIKEIEFELSREGYANSQLGGTSLRREFTAILKEATKEG